MRKCTRGVSGAGNWWRLNG
ncbi:hypothetical protein LINPERPRIM_LOCUS2736 [Linum perenne]